ncbi:uncharacterized protein LOC122858796 [Aphidius gifuensis]|uniref:uncharacterized protein LOC122858796 n=1 Tax=Aphidius gifuensis TaxID=684658 RepID=UPI001CDC320E|nr:uncharacterized protein LOC122858796 [Aphidius gifuensis]
MIALESNALAVDDSIKNYRVCLLEHFGLLRNGKINEIKQDGFYEIYIDDKELLEVVKVFVGECRTYANNRFTDQGDIAVTFYNCIEASGFARFLSSQVCKRLNNEN